ncbi:aldehyde dehydrogenase family protein [Pseudooceanicola sp. CBS1P-1]|uniref:Aldehyde dehydrogenase family protein n=1 Tax=Pseudooceanicola albus TaxID=2692189 RepID=A0A6L7GBE2_9RHOB|nr:MULTISPECIES: aldehyde dehydrogenase family protein [Pseudooceanicola]MBT9386852.1 aldehyde dehydrogenase family protein [Pseudooceanicola endophyticus]MXN21012.1 aldehyde dehydrogenase family protein [Pseudooceanicola albus]
MIPTSHLQHFYIGGAWVPPLHKETLPVINPATETPCASIALGGAADAERAVAAARAAFPDFSVLDVEARLELLRAILDAYMARYDDIARATTLEMGAPVVMAREEQAWIGKAHLEATLTALETFRFAEQRGTTRILREPIGVCALITPWNWPLNQIVCKVAPAIAAGCTMVLKPSEIAPLSGLVFAEVMEAAGVPAGVFNLVNGSGADVGAVLASHPEVDMVSFTGSTRAGVLVAQAAAPTVKRVSQELGGKSANILLPDADFAAAVPAGVAGCFGNTGQSCDAPTRMLVPAERMEEAMALATEAAAGFVTGDPLEEGTDLGPVISQTQFDKIQRLIGSGIAEGATLACGGPGRPEGLARGFFVKPTVFGHVTPAMTIAREEIFGPVLSIMGYRDEAEAVRIANDTPYGLAAYIQSADLDRARAVAAQMRAGSVYVNDPAFDAHSAFGGYKQSGNGREYADFGIGEFLETKSVIGFGAL